MTARILDLDGADRLLSLVDEIVTVRTAEPAPVGARIELRLGDAAAGSAVGKVVDAHRSGDGYRLRVRLFSLPRSVRKALDVRGAACSAGEAPGPPPDDSLGKH
jgi:hypothetical protein